MINSKDQARIAEALGIPKHCFWLKLEMDVYDPPRVTYCFHPSPDSDDIETIVKVCKELEYDE